MALLRVLMLAIAITLGTVLAGWWTVPLVALGFGVLTHTSRAPGLSAAAGGALAWGGYLGLAAAGGAPVRSFAGSLAASMQLPGWAPLVATLVFPALLAGLAAYLGARAGGRYLSPS